MTRCCDIDPIVFGHQCTAPLPHPRIPTDRLHAALTEHRTHLALLRITLAALHATLRKEREHAPCSRYSSASNTS